MKSEYSANEALANTAKQAKLHANQSNAKPKATPSGSSFAERLQFMTVAPQYTISAKFWS